MNSKRIYITLNPKRDEDRRVLEYLQNAEGSCGKAVIVAVVDYLDRKEHGGEYGALLQTVQDTIRECFQALAIQSSIQKTQTSSAENDDEMISPLDFIDAMTGGCSFP
jgi:hypothetical protein